MRGRESRGWRWMLAGAVSALAACEGAGGDGGLWMPADSTVEVALNEWEIVPSEAVVPAGLVTFIVTNEGTMVHELAIFHSDAEPGALPTLADGSADEAVLEEGEVGEVENLAPGETVETVHRLPPGRYVLLCNVVDVVPGGAPVSHYALGMYTAFEVR